MRRSLSLAFGLILVSQAIAASANVVTVDYRPDMVVSVTCAPGYATVIELEPGENVETVIVGDSDNWLVSSSARGDQLVVKPKSGAAATDLIVTSDRRRYAFSLTPQSGGSPTFVLHFQFANSGNQSVRPSRPLQQFRFGGSRELVPVEMRQSGKSTLIRWSDQTGIPAVFALKDDGSEILTNGRMVGDSYMVEGTANRFDFRLGKFRTTAVRTEAPTR